MSRLKSAIFNISRQKQIYIFLIFPGLFNIGFLVSSPQIIDYSENKTKTAYIGKELDILSEGLVFELLEKNRDIDFTFHRILMSGKMGADPNVEVNIQHIKNGYRVHMKDRRTEKSFILEWGIADILALQAAGKFNTMDKAVPLVDFTGHASWFRFTLNNPDDNSIDLMLELDKHMYSWFDLFYPEDGIYAMYSGAFEKPMSERIVNDSRTVFPIHLVPGNHTFFIRMDSKLIDTVPIRLWTTDEYYRHTIKNKFIHGCITGATLLLFIYALFLVFTMRKAGYLYLSLLIITGFMVHLFMSGLGLTFLWPEQPYMGTFFFCLMYPLTIIVNLLFCRNFLETPKYAPLIDKIIIGILAAALLLAGGQFFVPLQSRIFFTVLSLGLDYLSVFPLIIGAIMAIYRRSKGVKSQENKQGFYMLTAIGFQIFSYFEFWLSVFNIIPLGLIDFLHIRSIGFVLVMLFGVSSRIKYMERTLQKLKAELKEIINSKVVVGKEKAVTDNTQIKVEAVKELILNHYQEPLYRDDLAASVEMSSDHLGRMFKRLTGEKISDYINRLRIEEACIKLKEVDSRVVDIAFCVGFESLRTFNQCFVSINGMSPSAYRKRYYS